MRLAMKIVILAGGFGTRLSEYTNRIPKPMVTIGGKPLLWHIMSTFAGYGLKDFIIAAGYKSEEIRKYFLYDLYADTDVQIDYKSGVISPMNRRSVDWRVRIVDTGQDTMTGGRLNRLRQYLDDDPFLLTYGDGLSDVNIPKLIKFHRGHGKLATVTAVRPIARFGELKLTKDAVISFAEKNKPIKDG